MFMRKKHYACEKTGGHDWRLVRMRGFDAVVCAAQFCCARCGLKYWRRLARLSKSEAAIIRNHYDWNQAEYAR